MGFVAERVRGKSDDISFGPIFRVMMGSVRLDLVPQGDETLDTLVVGFASA